MESVPASELQKRLAEFLDEARSGQSFTITRNNRRCAQLGPVPEETDDD